MNKGKFAIARLLRFGGKNACFEKSGILLLVAAVIGAIVAAFARVMAICVDFVQHAAVLNCAFWQEGSAVRLALIFFMPLLGFAIAFLIYRHYKAPKNLTALIYGLHRYRASVPKYEMFSHLVASVFSVGLGGSAGLEAPGVLTGTAIASNLSDSLCIRGRARLVLVGCGAAAAISAIFRSPIAGVLFAVEALLPSLPVSVLVALTISSASAFWVSVHYLNAPLVYYASLFPSDASFNVWTILLLGVFSAFVGGFVIRSTAFVGGFLKRHCAGSKGKIFGIAVLCCGILFLLPHLRGQGHSFVEALLFSDTEEMTEDMWVLGKWLSPHTVMVITLLAALLVKPIASAISIECGDGGIFAPTLFIGAAAGYVFARSINHFMGTELPLSIFAALGMCGVFAAVMRSPLTAIFLVLETTHGMDLMPSLMIVAAIAWFVGRFVEPNSIYRKPLVAAQLVSDDRVTSVLMNIPVSMCMTPKTVENDGNSINEDTFANVALDKMQELKVDSLVVLDAQSKPLGVVTKAAIFDKYLATSTNR